MARPIKTTADWFKFLHGFPSSPKMKAIRHHYKNRGAIILIYIWDYLLGQDYQRTIYNEETLDMWSIDFEEDVQFIKDVVDCCLKYKLLQLDKSDNIYSEDLNELLSGLNEKRIKDRDRLKNKSRSDNDSSRGDNDSSRSDNGSSRSDNGSFRSDNGSSRSEKGGFRKLSLPKRRVEKSREESRDSSLRSESMSDGCPTLPSSVIRYDAFIAFFNETVSNTGIKKISKINNERKRLLDARFKEYGKDTVVTVIKKAAASAFLNGSGSEKFVATFDWLIRPRNFLKTLEGNYDNREFNTNKTPQSYGTDANNGYRTSEDLRAGAARIIAEMQAEAQRYSEEHSNV